MKTNKQKTNKQALLNHKVLCSLLAAGFFCSWGAAAPVYAAVATQKVVNSDLAGGLETNSESVKVTGGSRITGTVKVINDAPITKQALTAVPSVSKPKGRLFSTATVMLKYALITTILMPILTPSSCITTAPACW